MDELGHPRQSHRAGRGAVEKLRSLGTAVAPGRGAANTGMPGLVGSDGQGGHAEETPGEGHRRVRGGVDGNRGRGRSSRAWGGKNAIQILHGEVGANRNRG